jgi:hypothetical protein
VEVMFATPVVKHNIGRNFTDVEISKINDILKIIVKSFVFSNQRLDIIINRIFPL